MIALEVYNEFKALCPNYPFQFDEGRIRYYLKAIDRVKTMKEVKESNPYIPPDPEKVRQYNEWKVMRKPDNITDLPEKVQVIIGKILNNHPEITGMWVCGSYASGAWIDESTDDSHKDLKKEVKGKCKISDLDLIIEPEVALGEYEMKIDICHFPQNDLLKVK